MKTVKEVLEKPANEISESKELDINSKRIRFIDHLYAIIYSALHGSDLTDTSIDNGISKLWLSKLNNSKSYIPFIQLFYKLLEPYIKAYDYCNHRFKITHLIMVPVVEFAWQRGVESD